ncbi:hypothetical protein LDENG_00088320 [Lucifuga dentata]|nr:hypothetical protein LDENG_00088320 [Lucifuga dentata]
MGLEKEKSETSIIMDEDEFSRSIEPILNEKGPEDAEPPGRDPHNINAHLKVGFEDVLAEPTSTHSFDSVWIGSHAAFELVKFVIYRLLSALLAVPAAFLLGLIFAVISCVQIWLVMPLMQSFMMVLLSLQTVWRSLTDMFVTPFFQSMGKCLSSIHAKITED